MMSKKSIYTKLAFEAIKEYLTTNSTTNIEKQEIPEDLLFKRACFVTLKDINGKLRGCIGTIKPTYKNLHTEIIRNAVSSATKDSRFKKLSLKELEDTRISIEVLSKPEEITDIKQLNPKKYGLIIADESYRRGVLLPNIEGVDTIDKQIMIVKKKASINQKDNTGLKFYRFETNKYH